MDFYEVLDQVIDLLRRRGRVTYRALKRQFGLDDDFLEDLKAELIKAQQLAVDENGEVLVWTGSSDITPSTPGQPSPKSTAPSTTEQERAPLSYTPQHLAEKILTNRNALQGERKQVTVMFADIKDSTELIRDLDPEDAQKLLDPAIHIMMDAVHRFEGTVNQVLGDGIMALFGAPVAHEDHAARACYAALAMQAAMREYTEDVRRSHGLTLRVRVGLNAGEVVVRAIGNDLHMDYSAVGPTTHLAARMEQLADPGSIILTVSTLRLVEGLVRVNALGPVPVKGMAAPIEAYELTGARTVRRRLQAAVARGLTRFVGRDTEIETLAQSLERAQAGQGQVVAAVGEAGVGKSRLLYEFIHSHRTQGWLVLESASVSYGKATPYFPIIDLLKRYAHVEDGDDRRTTRAKLTGQILTLDEALHEITPALLALCDVLPDDHAFHQLDSPQRRQHTLDGLKRLLLRESQEQPLLLVFEDLHWIDSETQALLDNLVESLPTATLLLLVNYRPEYQHTWGSKTFYSQLRLDPLPAESADLFLQALLGDDPSLASLKPLLIERTHGNPFFLEETVRTLLETGILVGEAGAYRLAQALPSFQVPDTVQAILAARIDRLPQEEKQLLQTAAVIGTEVPLSLLQAIAGLPGDGLQQDLAHLQAAEFVYETQLFPERVYTFKHALTHEVAYASLLQERRRVLHARIVETLATSGSDRLADQIEQLAHHATRSEIWDKALHYCRLAGAKAMSRSAHRQAVTYFEQALSACQYLPEDRNRQEQALELRLELLQVRRALGELHHMRNDLQEAESLANTLGESRLLRRVALSAASHHFLMGQHEQTIVSARRILATFDEDVEGQVQANYLLGMACLHEGAYQQAVDHFRQSIAPLTGDLQHERFGTFLITAVAARCFLAWSLAEIGRFDEGIAIGTESIRIAEAANHPASLGGAYLGAGYPYLRRGDLHQALPLLERALHICYEAGMTFNFPTVAFPLGSAYTLAGRIDDAVQLLTQAMQQAVAIGRMSSQPLRIACLGEAHLQADHPEEAAHLLECALTLARTQKERGWEAYILRLYGDFMIHRHFSDARQAETHYQQALTLASELGMRPLQGHCHRGLGTLYGQTGQVEQARTELSTAIDMYRDMEMMFWLPETEAALSDVEGMV